MNFSQVETDYKKQMNGYLDDTRIINQKLQKLHADFTVFAIFPEEYYYQKELLTEESLTELMYTPIKESRLHLPILTRWNPFLTVSKKLKWSKQKS